MRRSYLHLLIGITVTAISAWLLLRSIPLGELWQALLTPNYWWLIPNLLCGFLALSLQAVRWRLLLSPLKTAPHIEVLTAVSIGLLFNNILPFRLGEYGRALVLHRQDKDFRTSPVLATVLVERLVFDLGFLLFIALIVTLFVPRALGAALSSSVFMLAVPVGLILTAIMIAAARPARAAGVISPLLRLLPAGRRESARQSVAGFTDMLGRLRRGPILLRAALLTALIWMAMAASIYFLFIGFSFDLHFAAPFVLLAAVVVAMFVPSLPGSIGTFHLAAVIALSAYGVPGVAARAFAVVLHLSQYVPITLIGVIFLQRVNLSLRQVTERNMAEA